MDTKEKLLKAFERFRPHINGHKTAIDLFFEGIKEVEDLQEQVKNLNIPAVMGELTCDSCGCHPNVIYTTSKGRFCERCKPAS